MVIKPVTVSVIASAMRMEIVNVIAIQRVAAKVKKEIANWQSPLILSGLRP